MLLNFAAFCFVLIATQAQVVNINQAVVKVFLAVHNAARAEVGVSPLTWNWTLSDKAGTWGKKCQWEHSDTKDGENLYASYPRSSNNTDIAGKAVKGWVSEKRHVVKQNWSCIGREINSCGHYSQVVWRNTKTVGCAIIHCKDDLANYVVCQYLPSGNWVRQKPY